MPHMAYERSMERDEEMQTAAFDPTYYKCVFWLMAVFRHDKRRQIVSQNNFADISYCICDGNYNFSAVKTISTKQPTKPTDTSNRKQRHTHANQHTFTFSCVSTLLSSSSSPLSKRCTFCGLIPFNIHMLKLWWCLNETMFTIHRKINYIFS